MRDFTFQKHGTYRYSTGKYRYAYITLFFFRIKNIQMFSSIVACMQLQKLLPYICMHALACFETRLKNDAEETPHSKEAFDLQSNSLKQNLGNEQIYLCVSISLTEHEFDANIPATRNCCGNWLIKQLLYQAEYHKSHRPWYIYIWKGTTPTAEHRPKRCCGSTNRLGQERLFRYRTTATQWMYGKYTFCCFWRLEFCCNDTFVSLRIAYLTFVTLEGYNPQGQPC